MGRLIIIKKYGGPNHLRQVRGSRFYKAQQVFVWLWWGRNVSYLMVLEGRKSEKITLTTGIVTRPIFMVFKHNINIKHAIMIMGNTVYI